MTKRTSLALDAPATDKTDGLRIWCETTPPDDEYADLVAGYCAKCKTTRTQTESGFLYAALVVTLHDEQGKAIELAPTGKVLFSQHVCCATCGVTLGAGDLRPRTPRRKRHTR